jgi:hypothetical protein
MNCVVTLLFFYIAIIQGMFFKFSSLKLLHQHIVNEATFHTLLKSQIFKFSNYHFTHFSNQKYYNNVVFFLH